MFSRTFAKAFATTAGICAAAGGLFAGGAALLGGATVAAPVLVGAAAVGVLGSAGVMAAGHYIFVPFVQFFVDMLSIFSGVRFTSDANAEKIRDESRGITAGLTFSGIAGAVALATASAQGAYNVSAEKEQPAQATPFTCADTERRVEQVITAADGSRVLQVSCQRR